VTPPAWAPILRDILRREQRSFLQYVDEAFPWTAQADEERLTRLRQLIVEEQRSAVGLANYLRRRHVDLPYSRSYPLGFTALNFVSLDFLLPQLIAKEQEAIAQLEADAGKIKDSEPREVVKQLIELKRRQLKALEELTAKPVHA
jgi:rubrerythrin